MWRITCALIYCFGLYNDLIKNIIQAEPRMPSMTDYVSNIFKQYNEEGGTVFISLPKAENLIAEVRSLNMKLTLGSLVTDNILKSLNQKLNFPVKIQNSEKNVSNGENRLNYILYYLVFFRFTSETNLEENIKQQFLNFELSLNPTGMYFLCAIEEFSGQNEELAHQILRRVNQLYNIWNILLILPKQRHPENFHCQQTEDTKENLQLDTYSLNPMGIFKPGNCSSQFEIGLVNRFPNINKTRNIEVPVNLNGCTLHISPSLLAPYTLIEEIKDQNRTVTYNYSGLEVAYLHLVAEKLNLTLKFHPPISGNAFETRFRSLQAIQNGNTDIVLGGMILLPLSLRIAEPTLPYIKQELAWIFPCSQPFTRLEKILDMYTLYVWILILSVLNTIPFALWFSSKFDYNSRISEPNSYKSILNCLCIVWAISLSSSVKDTPTKLRTKFIFIIFVYYSIVMSTIFQAIFITFLVEPGFPKALETFEELLHSDFKYGTNSGFETWFSVSGYNEFNKFTGITTNCEDIENCVIRLLRREPIILMSCRNYINYYSSTFIEVERKWCSLQRDIFSVSFSMYFRKGSLLLKRFNNVLRRCIESGLIEKYWEEMKLRRSSFNAKEHNNFISSEELSIYNNMYFVFSLNHLKLAFIVLLLGYGISSCVFLIELILKYINVCFMSMCEPEVSRRLTGHGPQRAVKPRSFCFMKSEHQTYCPKYAKECLYSY
ncbi:Ionotropic receptor 661 [Blattella germanica]|nr:Ionotropic receptor 661 [Blattella germanica]